MNDDKVDNIPEIGDSSLSLGLCELLFQANNAEFLPGCAGTQLSSRYFSV